MSRLGRKPLPLPPGVSASTTGSCVEVRGPRGVLSVPVPSDIVAEVASGAVRLKPAEGRAGGRGVAMRWGTAVAHLRNALTGVAVGFEKKLELQGVGYRAELREGTLRLSVGFSHPVDVRAPAGITFAVEKNIVAVRGFDKQVVGETAATIRRIRPPEPYKGKGIRYLGEVVRRKAGKVAGAATATS